jgi:hypothetical protein
MTNYKKKFVSELYHLDQDDIHIEMTAKSAVIKFLANNICLKYNVMHDLISKRDFGQF